MSLSPLYIIQKLKVIFFMKEYNGKPLSPEKFITFFYHSPVGQYITCWKNASNLKNVSHYQHGNNFA